MGSYNYYKVLGCFNRKFKISETGPPPDVSNAFSLYTEKGSHMTGDQLGRFMVDYQGEKECTINDAEQIIQEVVNRRHHLTKYTKNAHSFELEDFFYYLFQDDLNAPIKSQVHHDMNAPLQHYFIYTGHNSYLTGNQLSSDCSEIPIIRALERGVRGIELDLWPNSAKDNVHVLHGRTLTTPVPLLTCLRSIRDHAFIKSPYPVMITLEDHLTPDLQAKVAEAVIQVFGEMLYYPRSECLEEFPSPEELKHRIILSTKPPKEYLESKHHRDIESASPAKKDSVEGDILGKEPSEVKTEGHEANYKNDTDQDDKDGGTSNYQASEQGAPHYKRLTAINAGKANSELKHELIPEELKHQTVHATKSPREDPDLKHAREKENATMARKDAVERDVLVKDTPEIIVKEREADERSDTDQDDEDNDTSNNQSSQKGAPQYKRLIAIRAGKAKHGVKLALTDEVIKFNRLSLDEHALEKAATNHGKDLVRFTQRNILRVFPKGTRVTSSNFKPMIGWMHGAQMVAFNMQGYGKSLWIMHGMFRSNGGCGYVRKPSFLMERGPYNELFDPKVTLPVKKTLRVRVYLGDGWRMDFSHTHFDAFSPPDFYTKLYIIGVPADAAKSKTRIIEDDWGPIWGEEFKFPLTVPELALLRIEVREYDMSDKDDFGGQTCLPVSELRPGIRAVPLYDKKGEKLKSVRLLMQFRFI
uniref:Phosphoinositide phospholipase C n=1 Tax=Solanum tuberosum TaxID=4113 RepID=M1AVA0_SOLTU